MHVLILNQTFHPDVAATGQLMWDLARHLRAEGHRVTVVTSRGFYGTTNIHPLRREMIEGVDIRRVGGTRLGKRSQLARLADFASFYVAAAVELHNVPRPDVVLALTSPPLVATLGMLYKQFFRGTRFVYHIMDLYPDAAMAMDVIEPSSRVGHLLRRMTARTLDTADGVIVLGRDMRERLLAVYHRHARAEHICVVPPWADGQKLFPRAKSEIQSPAFKGLDETFNVVYSGNLGMAHDVQTIIAAIDASRRNLSMRWIFIGGGKRWDELRREAGERKWPHVRFFDFVDRERLNDGLNLADVHLVSQLPAFSGIVVPSKLFGIMAVGKPTIMIGPADAECSRIISENAAGFVIRNGDAGLLLARIQLLSDNPEVGREMGKRARAAFERQFDRAVACRRIEAVLRCVMGDGRSGGVPAEC